MTGPPANAAGRRTDSAVPLLRLGFRPFFLAAGTWAVVAMAAWLGFLAAGHGIPSAFDPVSWHIHEMVFGFAMAAVSGFLLTAIPNWTGSLPVAGVPLALLAGLWLAGRVACGTSAYIGAATAAVIDLAFPVVLLIVVAREIVGGANWRNLPMAAAVALLLAGNAMMHLEASGVLPWFGVGWRFGLSVVLMLIVLIGGRIVPSFTRNWLVKRNAARLPAPVGRLDTAVMAISGVALISWIVWPEAPWTGGLLAAAGAGNLVRLWRWRGIDTLSEPLVWVLHLGYGWLAVGLAILGLAILTGILPPSAAVHALTVGAVGTMTLGVMTRASLGHSGRPLAAGPATTVAYGLVSLAALDRLLAEALGWTGLPPLVLSAALWMAAFAVFVVAYMPLWVRGRATP